MNLSVAVLLFVTLQRLAELILARRNTLQLLAQGAREAGRKHYPLIVSLHLVWLAGLWVLGSGRSMRLGWLVVFVVLQALRAWVIVSLGPRWTTRIIISNDAPLVRKGPYRLLRHPNYLVVACEIVVLPLAFGLALYAAVFGVANLVVLALRIRVEDQALRSSSLP